MTDKRFKATPLTEEQLSRFDRDSDGNIICPKCKSSDIKRNGYDSKGNPKFRCKNQSCKRTFNKGSARSQHPDSLRKSESRRKAREGKLINDPDLGFDYIFVLLEEQRILEPKIEEYRTYIYSANNPDCKRYLQIEGLLCQYLNRFFYDQSAKLDVVLRFVDKRLDITHSEMSESEKHISRWISNSLSLCLRHADGWDMGLGLLEDFLNELERLESAQDPTRYELNRCKWMREELDNL